MTQLKKIAALSSVLIATGLVASASAAETATATISSTSLGGGNFQYNIALKNTSASTSIGTFWFSWVPGYDFMSVSPNTITAPTGWINPITGPDFPGDGYAIEFYNTGGSGDQLAPGATDNFSFDSTETLTQLQHATTFIPSDTALTSFVYAGTPESDPGFQFSVAVPEPVSMSIMVFGAGALMLRRRSRA
jgi:hypothetical protein